MTGLVRTLSCFKSGLLWLDEGVKLVRALAGTGNDGLAQILLQAFDFNSGVLERVTGKSRLE
jgi:hypothetical protein